MLYGLFPARNGNFLESDRKKQQYGKLCSKRMKHYCNTKNMRSQLGNTHYTLPPSEGEQVNANVTVWKESTGEWNHCDNSDKNTDRDTILSIAQLRPNFQYHRRLSSRTLFADWYSLALGTSEEDNLCLTTALSCAMIVPQLLWHQTFHSYNAVATGPAVSTLGMGTGNTHI